MPSNTGKDTATPERLRGFWERIELNHDLDVELVNPWFTPALKLDKTRYEDWQLGKITVTVGDSEILRDDIVRVAEVMKVSCIIQRDNVSIDAKSSMITDGEHFLLAAEAQSSCGNTNISWCDPWYVCGGKAYEYATIGILSGDFELGQIESYLDWNLTE
jgi:hypothetical protein